MRLQPLPMRVSHALPYGVAVVSTLLAFLATLLLAPYLGQSIFPLFLAAVMVSAWYGGLGPGLLAAGLSAVASLNALLPSDLSLSLSIETGVRIAAFLVAAVLISGLSAARRRSEAAAYDAQERYAITLDSIGDAVIVTDREGRVTLMNPVAEALTGWPLSEAQGRPIDEVFRIINETTRLTVESPVERALREGRVVGLANHTLLIARDGTERPIDDSGAPVRERDGGVVGAVLVFRDVSARREEEQIREEALRREQAARDSAEAAERRATFLAQASALLSASLAAEETLQAIARLAVSAVADLCVVFLQQPDGMIRRAAAVHIDPEREQALLALQQAAIDPAGPHPAAQVIRSGTSLLEPPVSDAVLASLTSDPERQASLRDLIPRSHLVVPLIARGITLGALSLGRTGNHQPYTSADMLLAEELAQRAALAVDNARLYEEAQAAIRARDRFLSLAAHELRTPLTATQGNLQLARRRLAEGEAGAERVQRSLRLAGEQLSRLTGMIDTLLDVSQLEGGQLSLSRTRVDVCALARRVVEQTEAGLTHHTLACDTPASELVVSGDPLRLEQVLANLLQNAVKYSPSGGAITVRVGRQNDRAFVVVADQGTGIPAEALPHLFERFYRAPRAEQGTIRGMGIGLYVVQEIVARHDGTVQVESIEGEGSTFTVWLPLALPSPSITAAST
jgi:PAS domain S-box-containing protein